MKSYTYTIENVLFINKKWDHLHIDYGSLAWFSTLRLTNNTFFMKIISTKAHAILDYLMGILLIASPWLFGFAGRNGNDGGDNDGVYGAETWVPVVLGIGTLLYSLFTNYEYSAARKISMKTHLALDTFSGIFLAASPWIFGFSEHVYLPHLILGIAELGAVMLTDPTPGRDTATRTGNRGSTSHHPA